jgi:hypothetical protein
MGGGNSEAPDSAADTSSTGSVDSGETPGGTTGGTSASGIPGQPQESAENRPLPESPGVPSDMTEPYSQPGNDMGGDPGGDDIAQQAAFLDGKISELMARIESGASDRDYAKWSSIKGEKYITHDSERLEYYQNKLDEL